MSRNRNRSVWVYPTPLIAVLAVSLFLFTSVPSAAAAAPVRGPFSNGCDPATYGDPYPQAQGGIFGGGAWSENFSSGVFSMAGPQYATSSGGIHSYYSLQPWIHFGPGTPNATSCIVEKSAVTTGLTFFFDKLSWQPVLQVNCVGEGGTADAQYYLNVSGDLYDYTTSSWVVSPVTHVEAQVAQLGIGCNAPGSYIYTPKLLSTPGVIATTAGRSYTLNPHQEYFYFADITLAVIAMTTGGSSAVAEVANVHVSVANAYCPHC